MPGSTRIDRTARARVRRSSRDVETNQGTLRPPAFARNQKVGGRFRLRGLLTRPASVTAGVVARKVWNLYFSLPNARTVPVRRWSCTNTVELAVKSWEPVGYFALSPCGRGVAPVSSTLRTRRFVVPSPPLPNPLPQGEREPEVPSTKGVIAGSTGLRHGGVVASGGGTVVSGTRTVASSQWPVNAKRGNWR